MFGNPYTRTSCISIRLHEGISEYHIGNVIKKNKLEIFKTSDLMNRYIVEVPVGKEKYFLQILQNTPEVKSADQYFIKGFARKRRYAESKKA